MTTLFFTEFKTSPADVIEMGYTALWRELKLEEPFVLKSRSISYDSDMITYDYVMTYNTMAVPRVLSSGTPPPHHHQAAAFLPVVCFLCLSGKEEHLSLRLSRKTWRQHEDEINKSRNGSQVSTTQPPLFTVKSCWKDSDHLQTLHL